MTYHLIFEGAELTGKSTIISRVYRKIEQQYNSGIGLLDGCYWFNCDVGIFGDKYGWPVIKEYVDMANVLRNRNIIFEKLHFSHLVNAKLLGNDIGMNEEIEKSLTSLNFKVIMVEINEDLDLMKHRIADRLRLYPHYKDILHKPEWYFEQQRNMKELVVNSNLDHLIVNTSGQPDKPVSEIVDWLGL